MVFWPCDPSPPPDWFQEFYIFSCDCEATTDFSRDPPEDLLLRKAATIKSVAEQVKESFQCHHPGISTG